MVRLRTLVILVITCAALTAGTALAAASWYWRGGTYVLPRYNQTAALQEILTEHKNQIDGLASVLGDTTVYVAETSFYGFLPDTDTPTPILSDTITLPRDGMLLIWGTWSAFEFGEDGDYVEWAVRVSVDGTAAGRSAVVGITDRDFGLVDPDDDAEAATVMGYYPVTAGNHTVSLDALSWFHSMDVWVYDIQLHTLFLPFGTGP